MEKLEELLKERKIIVTDGLEPLMKFELERALEDEFGKSLEELYFQKEFVSLGQKKEVEIFSVYYAIREFRIMRDKANKLDILGETFKAAIKVIKE